MSPGRATDLVKGILIDLDAALASNGKEALDERHSALASAGILAMRLFGGVAINLARIATAVERIANTMEDHHDDQARSRQPGDAPTLHREGVE